MGAEARIYRATVKQPQADKSQGPRRRPASCRLNSEARAARKQFTDQQMDRSPMHVDFILLYNILRESTNFINFANSDARLLRPEFSLLMRVASRVPQLVLRPNFL